MFHQRSTKSESDQAHRVYPYRALSPLNQNTTDRASRRNSMAIRNLLNPTGEDDASQNQHSMSIQIVLNPTDDGKAMSDKRLLSSTAGSFETVESQKRNAIASIHGDETTHTRTRPRDLTLFPATHTSSRTDWSDHDSQFSAHTSSPASSELQLSQSWSSDSTRSSISAAYESSLTHADLCTPISRLELVNAQLSPSAYHVKAKANLASRDSGHQKKQKGAGRGVPPRGKPRQARTKYEPPRPYRVPYDCEHNMYIWFFTTDVPLSRSEKDPQGLYQRFNRQFPGLYRRLGGLLSNLYRLSIRYDLPKRRQQREAGGHIDPNKYGMWAVTRRHYKWMDEYAHKLPGYLAGGPYND